MEFTLIHRLTGTRVEGWRLGLLATALLLSCHTTSAQAALSRSLPPNAIIAADATVFSKNQIQGILGKKVLSGSGKDMGQIVNVIVDRTGQARAAVIDFGGFLGVGSRKIAVDWTALHFAPQGKTDQVTLDLTPDQLKAAPEYEEDKPVIVIGPSGRTSPLPAEP